MEQPVPVVPLFCISHLGKGKGKLGKAVLAGDGDVLLIGVQKGLDDVQS